MVLLLSNLDVYSVVSMVEVLEAVEEGFREYSLGRVRMPVRVSLNIPRNEGWVGVMPVYMEEQEILTTKIVTSYPKNIKHGLPNITGVLVYNDSSTGVPLAFISVEHLTALRTGAASGVATKYLAKNEVETLGMIGSGKQAKTQLEAISQVRDLKLVKVYSPNPQHRKTFAEEMGEKLGIDIIPVESSRLAVENSDVVVTATTSKTPVFDGKWLREGVHINSIGAHTPDSRELDNKTIKKSKIVVDSKDAALRETGDLIIPMKEGIISKDSIYAELGEIVLGRKKGRTSDREITLFKSVGLAFQDAVVAKLVYEKAKKLNLGREIRLA